MQHLNSVTKGQQQWALWTSMIAFTACFAVWTIFSIIGIRIQAELGLTEAQFGLLIPLPILTGSVARLFLGIASERWGGRRVTLLTMGVTAVSVWLLTWAQSYAQFLIAVFGQEFQQPQLLYGGFTGAAAAEINGIALLVHLDALEHLHRVEIDIVHVLVPQRVIIGIAHDLTLGEILRVQPLRPADAFLNRHFAGTQVPPGRAWHAARRAR